MRITRARSAVFAGIAFVVFAATPVPRESEWSSSALASESEQNSSAAAGHEKADEHACREPAGERSHSFSCFTSLGPIHFAGRVRALVVRPDDPNTVWAATASGGLWFTHDGGDTWNPANDQLQTLAFSSLAIDPNDPDIMYAGSGEIHTTLHLFDSQLAPRNLEIGSDAGLNLRAPRRGAGIFKTLDGGAHWSLLTGTFGKKDFFYVSRIAVSPQSSSIVLAATATGLWRSGDGGANWVLAQGRINLPTGGGFPFPLDGIFLDVKFHPRSQGNVVATGLDGHPWFSTDGGVTFNTSSLPARPAVIPADAPSRIELAPLPSQAGAWFAAEIFSKNSGDDPIVLLRSTDNGATFGPWSNPSVIACGNNRLYTGALFVSDGSRVYFGGNRICRSDDGGRSFVTMKVFDDNIHSDNHAIVPAGSDALLVGNDGGVFLILDTTTLNPPIQVKNKNNMLVNQQFYGAARNPSGIIVAGAQDIGTLHRGTDGTWTSFSCCDGPGGADASTTAADPVASDLFYFGNTEGQLFRSTPTPGGWESIISAPQNPNTDQPRCLNATPILLDPGDPNTLFVGCERLWVSGNVRATSATSITWSPIKPADPASTAENQIVISAIALAPWSRNVMWVGTNHIFSSFPILGTGGELWMTSTVRNAAPDWVGIADPTLPVRPVSGVALHPTDPSRVYVSYSGWDSLDFTQTSHNLYRGIRGPRRPFGFSFSDISAGLPAGPVYCVAVSPDGAIAVGTEVGVRISFDDGATWLGFPQWGPRAPIAGLTWIDANHLLVASYGRGVFTVTP